MFQGYLPLNCVFPPGKGGITSWRLAVRVLKNLLQAHTETYQALKAMPHGDEAQIGLVHQYLKFETATWYNPLEKIPGFLLNHLMVDSVIDFLKTGTFDYGIWGITRSTYQAPIDEDKPAAAQIADFVGLNYYSRVFVKFSLPFTIDSSCADGETMTDMPYAIYPEGMYKALHHMAEIGLPIYITENGVADHNDENDERRVQWVRTYLKAVSLALEDGIDIRGFYYWTLTDNFEWDAGWDMRFGMYDLNRETQERTLKDGGRAYATICKAHREGKYTEKTLAREEAYNPGIAVATAQ